MKKIITFLMCLIVSFSLFPSICFAGNSSENEYTITIPDLVGKVEYEIEKKQAKIKTIVTAYDLQFQNIVTQGISVSDITRDEADPTNINYTLTIEQDSPIPDNIPIEINMSGNETKTVYKGVTDRTTILSKPTNNVSNFPYVSTEKGNMGNYDYGNSKNNGKWKFNVAFDKEKGFGKITFYYAMNSSEAMGSPRSCSLLFKTKDSVISDFALKDMQILNNSGVWTDKNNLFSENSPAEIITPYNQDIAEVKACLKTGIQLYLDDAKQGEEVSTDGSCNLKLSSSFEGVTHKITLKEGENSKEEYMLICYKQGYDAMPNQVVDYICPASQYTNGGKPAGTAYGTDRRAVLSLKGGKISSFGDDTIALPPVSLGNYGGYITYYYESAIIDNPNNPYGIDFIVYGNSFDGGSGGAEPGNVLVSEDGKKWYSLAGSFFYDEKSIWNYKVKYQNYDGKAKVILPDNTEVFSYTYPLKKNYAFFNWSNDLEKEMELSGTFLKASNDKNQYGNTLPSYPAFGYADCGMLSDSNIASNPYIGLSDINPYSKVKDGGIYSGRTDGFDLAWAVDENGKAIKLTNGIHYIKIQTASFIDNGAIGEKSTEVNMVRIAKANDSSVGKTADAEKITFDGTDIQLESGKYEYDASVSGAFDVQVKASDNANIYINSIRGNTANFKVAAHGVVRIIIQEGEKEPVIYYFKINDDNKSAENVITAVSLDAAGGQIYDYEKEILYFDKDSSVRELPIPTKDGCTFMGWYGGQQKYTKYEEGMPEEVNLVAKWKENNPKPLDPEKKITVSFRLIGATHSKGDVDLSSEEKNGYKGAEYVTWIPTRSYTLPEGSSVYDLFAKAMKDTGMKEKGGVGGYVSSIWAPSQFGGYELSEFTNGKYSGWMYTMNGDHTDGIKVQKLLNNAEIVFHYVNDYRYEVADWAKMGGEKWPQLGTGKFHNEWLKAPDRIGGTGGGSPVIEESKAVTTSGSSGSATTTVPTEVKVSGTTAAATVKAENQSEILKQATENKSAEIVLEVAASDTKGAENVQLQLETSFVKNISDKTNASLTLDTENGRVSFDQEALKAIISEAKGSTILIEIAKVTKPTEAQKKAAGTNGDIFRLVVKSGDKIISEFNKGKATVRVEIPAKLTDKKVAAIHIADDAKIEQLAGKVLTIGGKKYYEFTTPHFSTFALVDAEELGLEVEEPQVDAKALTAKLTPVARSAKTAKKNVKVTVSLDKQDKAIIKELKDAGYTVKYRFYRSTKKAAGYKAAVTKKTASYTNTGGKKGTKYFYKVQVRVYDENGKLTAKTALKQCKYASRAWSR